MYAFALVGFSQEEEPELDKRGGFQDIKLLSNPSDYSGLELKKEVKDEKYPGTQLYTRLKGSYESIGNVKVERLEVKSYQGKIYEILVETEQSPAVYQGLSSLFGEPQYNIREKAYYWKTKNIRLYFKPAKKDGLQLIYYSYVMERERRAEIQQSFTDVADDF